MAIELICGKCQGKLLVESPGTTVRCPHCSAILQTPSESLLQTDAFEVPDEPLGEALADLTATLDVPRSLAQLAVDDLIIAGSPFPTNEPAPQPASPPLVGDPATNIEDGASHNSPESELETVAMDVRKPVPTADATSLTAVMEPEGGTAGHSTSPKPVSSIGASSAEATVSSAQPPAGPSPLVFKLVVSYASAITLVCLYLSYIVWSGTARARLPDLPDLEPDVKKGNTVTRMWYLPPENRIHPAHMLRLGESQRFGSLRVTPLGVSRGPIEFTFFDPDEDESRSPTGPVLKLHLRIENVSDDQEFIPIDRQLVFAKEPDKQHLGLFKANNFVCRADERPVHAKHVLVYDLSADWIIRDQNLDRPLKPGEVLEVYIPTTEEGVDQLTGDLVWRVHFRKGYNPRSYRGVTTLIEVVFNSAEIVDEAHRAAGA